MPYSPEIIAAYDNWKKAESNVPDREYKPKYRTKDNLARKHWKIFADLCVKNNLHTVQVAQSLNNVSTVKL